MNLELSLNTQAILLLTAPLIVGKATHSSVKILTPKEYKLLARHLLNCKRQPADLLSSEAEMVLDECNTIIDVERLRKLLARGFLLSQAVERWQQRAIWVISRADAAYPSRLKARLREDAPAILYGCGNIELLDKGGLAIVGSRYVDNDLIDYTQAVAKLAVSSGYQIVSGGAKGIDSAAMQGAANEGGNVCGILADSLEKAVVRREHRDVLMSDRAVLISPYDPAMHFNVGNAMARNKLIYALSDAALIVNSDKSKGGTWSGAVEQLDKLKFVPLFVRPTGTLSEGLVALQKKGAYEWPEPTEIDSFKKIFEEKTQNMTSPKIPETVQISLWDTEMNESSNALSTQSMQQTPAEKLYLTVCHVIQQLLSSQSMKDSEIAEQLEVSKSQVKVWLNKLIDEGKVKKSGRPIKYIYINALNLRNHNK